MPQSLSQILVHLVFSTHLRRRTLIPEIRERVFPYMAGILANHGCPALSIGGTEDHVHVLFSLSRTVTIADTVKNIKKSSSDFINQQIRPAGKFSWQGGYGAFSIRSSDSEVVRHYIKTQEDHHKQVSFQDEFRKICAEFDVELDERYVWE